MSNKTARRHPARVHGTQTEHRAKRPAASAGLCQAAAEFNEAFDKVFCKRRPWLHHMSGWQLDPFLKPKKAAP
jgi:hypothetical protein